MYTERKYKHESKIMEEQTFSNGTTNNPETNIIHFVATLLTHALQCNIIGINQKLIFLLADNDIILLLYDSLPFSYARRMEK